MKRLHLSLSVVGLSLAACGGSSFESSGDAAGAAGAGGGAAGAAVAGAAGAGGQAGGGQAGGAGGTSGSGGAGVGGAAGNGGAAAGMGGIGGTAGGGAGGAAGGGTGGASGKAGSGGKAQCTMKSQCPPSTNPCQVPTCNNNVCGFAPAAQGTLPPPVLGDCQTVTCDGTTVPKQTADITDVPPDDGNPCTEAVCKGTTPTHDPSMAGKACGMGGVCNGTGKCGVCVPGAERCTDNGVAKCDAMGQWGPATPCEASTPVCSEAKCVAVVNVAAGKNHSCAVLSDGTMRCWGANEHGQCGVPATPEPVRRPVAVKTGGAAIEVALGASFSCARYAKKVVCWGANDVGQLGDGTTGGGEELRLVAGIDATSELVAGDHHACVVDNGKVRCWGGNEFGQVGSATALYSAVPSEIPINGNLSSVAAGFGHACAAAPGVGIYCWGLNDQGQLGRKLMGTQSAAPALIVPFGTGYQQTYSEVARVYSGANARHTLATLGAGQVAVWGSNAHGEVGYTGTAIFDGSAYFIDQDKAFLRLSTGNAFNCNLVIGGTVRCNGANEFGQLGRGSVGPFDANVQPVSQLPTATSIAAGDTHACAVSGGNVYCWGSNTGGQLSGSFASTALPRVVAW